MAIAVNKIAVPNRILVIKFSSIGDIVLTTSPLRTIKNLFPIAKIDFLTLENYAEMLEGNNYIDRIIPFDRESSLSKLIKIGKWIGNSNYNLVIDLHNSLRSKIIRLYTRNIPTLRLKKPRWNRFLLFRFRINNFSTDFSQIKLMHKPLINWKMDGAYPPPVLFLADIEKKQMELKLSKKGISNQYVVIIPGAAWRQKTWSKDSYCELINKIRNMANVDFVILGSENDKICSAIADCDPTIYNLQGKTSLREAMAVISNSMYVIGADTGLVHASEALGKRVLMIMGPTARETGAGTNKDDSINIENNDIWCRPCSQNGKRKCYRKEQYCLTTITPELVFDKMTKSGIL